MLRPLSDRSATTNPDSRVKCTRPRTSPSTLAICERKREKLGKRDSKVDVGLAVSAAGRCRAAWTRVATWGAYHRYEVPLSQNPNGR